MRVMCDTNFLVSGVLFRGRPRRILKMIYQGSVLNVTSPALLAEVEEVLARPKFGLKPSQVAGVLALFLDTFEVVHPSKRISAIKDDPDDNAILEAAEAGAVDMIVSGDKHLLEFRGWGRTRILSPAALVNEFTGDE